MFAIDDARLLLGKYEIAFGLGYDSSCGRASAIERSKPKRKDHYVGSPNICRIQQQRLTAAGMTSQDRSDQADERTEIHQGADCRQNKSSCRTIRRLRPILAHWASVDALRARVCVQAIASDNGTKRASSRAGASQRRPTARSFTIRVRLMPPAYVRPYVKRQKNDMADAEAICKAVTRANIRTGQGGN